MGCGASTQHHQEDVELDSAIQSHEKVHAWLDSVNHSMEGLSGSDVTFALSSNSCDLDGKVCGGDRYVDPSLIKKDALGAGRQRRGGSLAKRKCKRHNKHTASYAEVIQRRAAAS
eukprot:jgi/Ulvmu1/7946/UM004_0179.1